MTNEERHEVLDQIAAFYVAKTGKLLSSTSMMELIEWHHKQLGDEHVTNDSNAMGKSDGVNLTDLQIARDELEIAKAKVARLNEFLRPYEDEFMKSVRQLGPTIGYGRMIQLIQNHWRLEHKEKYGIDLSDSFFTG